MQASKDYGFSRVKRKQVAQCEPGGVGQGQTTHSIIGHGENCGIYSKKKWDTI